MIRTTFVLFVLAAGLTGSLAQSFQDYLKLRKSQKVTQATGIEALETLVGSRVVEIKGVVKGSVGSEDSMTLLLQTSEGQDVPVTTRFAPSWLIRGSTPARLLIRASRESYMASLRAELVMAADESEVAAYEAKERAKSVRSRPRSLTSRGGTRTVATRKWDLPASDAMPHYVTFIRRINRRLGATEASRIAQAVIGFSLQYGVDARLIMAMVMTESGFNPKSTSRVGAMGLGQLMPGTARGMGVTNAYDSVDNLYGTVRLVRGHLEKYRKQTSDAYQSLPLALAAYNAGAGAVKKYGGVPPYRETQAYVRKVIGLYRQLAGE